MSSTVASKKRLIDTVEMAIFYTISKMNADIDKDMTHILFPETSNHSELVLGAEYSVCDNYVCKCVTDYLSDVVNIRYTNTNSLNSDDYYCEIDGRILDQNKVPFLFLTKDDVVIHIIYKYLVITLTNKLDIELIKNDMNHKVSLFKHDIPHLI